MSIAAIIKNSIEVSQKLTIELLYDIAIPLLGIYLKKIKTLAQTDTCIPKCTAALFPISKIQKSPKCPATVVWMKKDEKKYIYI